MKVTQCADLGVEVSGLDISEITAEQAKALLDVVHRSKLAVISTKDFDEAAYVRFARALGEPQVYLQSHYHHPNHPEIFVSSTVKHDGKKFGVRGTGRYWHTDYAFMPEPLPLTMVTPRIIPQSSRGTLYIDMERVYEMLPSRLRQFVDTHDAIHEAKWRYKVQESDLDRAIIDLVEEIEKAAPAVSHPAVIMHPVRKKPALYISSGFTTGFRGVPYEEGKKWLAELIDFAERDDYVAQKTWSAGEILLWDNRCLLHKAGYTDVTEANLSYRIGVYDGLPFYLNPTRAQHASEHANA